MPIHARHIRRFGRRLGLKNEWYLFLVAALIGLAMALVATAFLWPLEWISQQESELSSELIWMLVLIGPCVGGLLVGLVRRVINAPYIGPGVTTAIYAVLRQRGRLRWRVGLQQWICSTLTIGSGGSAGAEGPIVTIGSAIGSSIGRALHLSSQNTTTLLGCGAAAGIAAVFNAPIAGVLFVMEILLRDFSLRTFTPIVIAAVCASASTQGILHDEAMFAIGPEFLLQEGEFRMSYIPVWALLGLLCGLIGVVFIRTLAVSENLMTKCPVPFWARPAIGGLLLALLGLGFLLLTGPTLPFFYGNGYPEIASLLSPDRYLPENSSSTIGWLLLAMIAMLGLKLVGTCITIGSGGAGGMFAPSLMMGALIGGALGLSLEWMGLLEHGTPARFALVGMAAMVASVTHAPLTGILIVYELTRQYEVVLPLMLAAVVATVVSRWLCQDSIYSARLRAAGIRFGGGGEMSALCRLTVQDLLLDEAVTVPAKASADDLVQLAEDSNASDFVVLDSHGQYLGMVTSQDLKATLVFREALPLLQVSELTRTDLGILTPEDTLDTVLEKFASTNVDALPVLVDGDLSRISGLVTRRRLMKRYQSALDEDA
ncbi:MAG: chloride channel protein [Phycisphaerales bacterium]|nr:chloride channel protein [Phycisphaerales bacterium]